MIKSFISLNLNLKYCSTIIRITKCFNMPTQESATTLSTTVTAKQSFWPLFISWFEPILVPNKQSKIYFNSCASYLGIKCFKFLKKLSVMHHTESQALPCASYRGVNPRCASHSRVKLQSAESESKILICSSFF